ncbi:MAG: hypothetical protein RIG68_28245 [Imperialibacter sp.]|uniref:hypothetical protein n=1 Tax=Imperialibacter sp. TaxID=2038411 RepID=UPI0032EB1C79
MANWQKERVVSAAGVYGAAWTDENKLIVTSPDGYSITPCFADGLQITRLGSNLPESVGYSDFTHYITEEYPNPIEIFNWDNPVGKARTSDGYLLFLSKDGADQEVFIKHQDDSNYLQVVPLERLENFDLSFSFSPNDECFAVVGSGGVEIFRREKSANKGL